MTRWTAAGLLMLTAWAIPRRADALLFVTKGKKASSDETSAVVLREGQDTVLSIAVRARGLDGDVALLVPVPGAPKDMQSLPGAGIASLGQVTGPRLTEVWEQDPCEFHPLIPGPTEPGDAASGAASASAAPSAPPPPAAVGAGDYRSEVLGEKTGAEIAAKLKGEGYAVPEGTEGVLDGYLKAGMKIAVARIEASKIGRDGDASVLPLFSVHYQAGSLTLPTRLLASGGGLHELEVFVLASGARFEASNQPNLAVPTNLDVTGSARSQLSPFYGALLDRTFEKNPGALVTEYAWRASTCELCASPLSAKQLGALGSALLPSAGEGKQGEVIIDAAAVAALPDGPPELRASLMACYGKALGSRHDLAGDVALSVEVGADGATTTATPVGKPDDALAACAGEAVKATKLGKPGAKGTLSASFSPVSRKYLGDLVLTRLRARYDAVPDQDLALRPARAIEGGREDGPDGAAPKRVYASEGGNDFQARYVIRHPFKGAVHCDAPQRGVWGGRPKDASPAHEKAAKATTPDAGAPHLDSWVVGGLPDFAAFAIKLPDLPAPAPSESAAPLPLPSASASAPAAAPSASPAVPKASGGCGACSSTRGPAGSTWWAALAIGALALRRRSRDRC